MVYALLLAFLTLVTSETDAPNHTYVQHVPLSTMDAAGVSISGGRMMFLGGSGTNDAMFLDVASLTWSVKHDVWEGASRKPVVGVSTPDGSLAFFAGGQGANKTNFVDVGVYHVANDSWSRAQLGVARSFLAAASITAPSSLGGGSLVLFGGGEYVEGVTGSDSAQVDIFWQKPSGAVTRLSSTDSLSKPRKKLAAAAAGKYVLFAGGYRSGEKNTSQRGYCDDVDIYDTATGKWRTDRLSQPRQYITGTSIGNKAIFAGGFCSPCVGQPNTSRSDVVDIFDASTGTFTSAVLSQRRSNLAIAGVGDRYAVIGGGTTDLPGVENGASVYRSNVVDIFDAHTGKWSTTHLGSGRCCLGAAGSTKAVAFCGGTISDDCDVFTFDDAVNAPITVV